MHPGRLALLALMFSFSCDLGVYDPEAVGGDGDGDGDTIPEGRYHPLNFSLPENHGMELKMGAQDCRSCHGADLAGDIAAPSCDTCHNPEQPQAWRTDCVFCHGGTESTTGAPPRDLDGTTTNITFPAHTVHMTTAMTGPVACTECHAVPTDVLSANHVFDDTKGAADVVFAAGRSPAGTYADGTCSNMYCHGTGSQNGAATTTGGSMSCNSCHGTQLNTGDHRRHRGDNCFECHNDTTKNDTTIADASKHIDGTGQAVVGPGLGSITFTEVGGQIRCSGSCHGEGHNDTW